MDEDRNSWFLPRSIILKMGEAILEDVLHITDFQILTCIESFFISDAQTCLEKFGSPEETRTSLMRLLSQFFYTLRAELDEEPPTLTFHGIPQVEDDKAATSVYTEDAVEIQKYAISTIASRHSDDHPWLVRITDPPAPYKPEFANTDSESHNSESSVKFSGISDNMSKNDHSVGFKPKADDGAASSSAGASNLGLKWETNRTKDPFGTRVSTEDMGSMELPFEFHNKGQFETARENMRYLAGDRPATAHFELSPEPVHQLQSGVDLTPDPVKAQMAINKARNEAAQVKIDAMKIKMLNVLGAQEITTAKGIQEEATDTDSRYLENLVSAFEDSMHEGNPECVDENVSAETVRPMQAQLKDGYKDHPSASISAEKTRDENQFSRSIDAPTDEDEAPAHSWIHPVADRVLDKATMQYNMMYDIVTKMQRDRLELGPEVTDYEVIAKAHAGYKAVDEIEVAELARAAETQKTTALALSVADDLRKAQWDGLPITQMGGLSLTQKEITSLLQRCDEVANSASAARDYNKSKPMALTDRFVDPFTTPEDLDPTGNATKPFTGKDLKELVDMGAAEGSKQRKQKSKKKKAAADPAPDQFDNSIENLEKNIEEMKAFRSRMGTTPRDFSKEIEEIERELAELKAHRANAPGDLVPDSVDGDECGIHVRADDYGDGVEHKQEEPSSSNSKAKPKSRAEQRRIARQKAKDKETANE